MIHTHAISKSYRKLVFFYFAELHFYQSEQFSVQIFLCKRSYEENWAKLRHENRSSNRSSFYSVWITRWLHPFQKDSVYNANDIYRIYFKILIRNFWVFWSNLFAILFILQFVEVLGISIRYCKYTQKLGHIYLLIHYMNLINVEQVWPLGFWEIVVSIFLHGLIWRWWCKYCDRVEYWMFGQSLSDVLWEMRNFHVADWISWIQGSKDFGGFCWHACFEYRLHITRYSKCIYLTFKHNKFNWIILKRMMF